MQRVAASKNGFWWSPPALRSRSASRSERELDDTFATLAERGVGARGFAEGHGGLRVPDPILATGLIAKEHIFAVFTDRKESEVLLDPARTQSQRLGYAE